MQPDAEMPRASRFGARTAGFPPDTNDYAYYVMPFGMRKSGRVAATDALHVRRVPVAELTQLDIVQWQDLLSRSVEPNPFLSPDFVLPLLKHVQSEFSATLLIVECSGTERWLLASVLEVNSPTLRWPLTYARGLSSPYCLLDGLLVDDTHGAASIEAMFRSQSKRRDWHGLHFAAIRRHSPLATSLEAAAGNLGIDVYRCREWARAKFVSDRPRSVDDILEHCSKSRRKSLRRGFKRLTEKGQVAYRLVWPDDCTHLCVESFLSLEQAGWKGNVGTALASQPNHLKFFLEMVDSFAAGSNVLFGELLLDGEAIASTCNLRCRDVLTAFKIGWNPDYAEAGIGMWSEVELASAISRQAPSISRIDSSAKHGSYVESIWKDSEPMTSVTYSWSNRGAAMQLARKCLQLLRESPPPTSDDPLWIPLES